MKLSFVLSSVTMASTVWASPLGIPSPDVNPSDTPKAAPSLDLKHLTKRIPASVYGVGQFKVPAQGTPIQILDNGVDVAYQIDGNFVVYVNGIAKWNSRVTLPAGCSADSCVVVFQVDGNLVTYSNGVATWSTNTGAGQGAWLVFFDVEPYIVIYNAAYDPIWHTPITTQAPVPVPLQQGRRPCESLSGGVCNQGPDSPPSTVPVFGAQLGDGDTQTDSGGGDGGDGF